MLDGSEERRTMTALRRNCLVALSEGACAQPAREPEGCPLGTPFFLRGVGAEQRDAMRSKPGDTEPAATRKGENQHAGR